MVRLDEIPKSKPRVDLETTEKSLELLAIDEKIISALVDSKTGEIVKNGGLQIEYINRENEQLTQKYSSAFGDMLETSLEELGYDSTEPLKTTWHRYEKQTPELKGLKQKGKTIYPRFFPMEKLESAITPETAKAKRLNPFNLKTK